MYDQNFNDPYMMMMMMQQGKMNTSHMFNSMIGYNQFFMPNANQGYNVAGNMSFLQNPYASYNFGLKDYIKHDLLGFHRAMGMNGVDARLASSMQHDLLKSDMGDYGIQSLATIASLGLGGPAGIVAGFAIDATAGAYMDNKHDYYKDMMKTAMLTSNFIGTNGQVGFSSSTIKDINKSIRDVAAQDTLFSKDDIQNMMKSFTTHGFLNDVSSGREYKDIVRTLKDRVRDLSEFLGETNPTKLLEGLSKYKSIGFSKSEAFKMMKAVKTASDFSGISKDIIEQQIGMEVNQRDNVGTDERITANRVITESMQVNALSRSGFMPGYLSDKKKALAIYSQANAEANVIMQKEMGLSNNQLMYLAMNMQKEKGGSLNDNYHKLTSMKISEIQGLVSKYSSDNKEFGATFWNNDVLRTVVQSNKEVGSVSQDKTAIMMLIKKIYENHQGNITKNEMLQQLSYKGLSADSLSIAAPIVNGYYAYGGFDWLEQPEKQARQKEKTKNAYNQYWIAKEKTSFGNEFTKDWNILKEHVSGFWGGSEGEEVALKSIDRFRNTYAIQNKDLNYVIGKELKELKKITGSKNIYKNLFYKMNSFSDNEEEHYNISDIKDKLKKGLKSNVLVDSGDISMSEAVNRAFQQKYRNSNMDNLKYLKASYSGGVRNINSEYTGKHSVLLPGMALYDGYKFFTGYTDVGNLNVDNKYHEAITSKGKEGLQEALLLEEQGYTEGSKKSIKSAKKLTEGFKFYKQYLKSGSKEDFYNWTYNKLLTKKEQDLPGVTQLDIENNKKMLSFIEGKEPISKQDKKIYESKQLEYNNYVYDVHKYNKKHKDDDNFKEKKVKSKEEYFKDKIKSEQDYIKTHKFVFKDTLNQITEHEKDYKEIIEKPDKYKNNIYTAILNNDQTKLKKLFAQRKYMGLLSEDDLMKMKKDLQNSKRFSTNNRDELLAIIQKQISLKDMGFIPPEEENDLIERGATKFVSKLDKMDKKTKKAMNEALKSGDSKEMLSIAENSGDKQLLSLTRSFVTAYDDDDMSEKADKARKVLQQKEFKVIKDIKKKLHFTDNNEFREYLGDLAKGDDYKAYLVAKRQNGNENMSYEEFKRTKNLASISSEFGFDDKQFDTMKKIDGMSSNKKETLMYVETKKVADNTEEMKKILAEIKKDM